jgi:hypothetical protein
MIYFRLLILGIFQFPPPPPHAELPPLPNAYHLKDLTNNLIEDFPSVFFVKPGLTDFGCTEHSIGEISASKIAQLAISCHHRLGSDILTPVLPTKVEVKKKERYLNYSIYHTIVTT